MADLVVITPTRGRPKQFAELVDSVSETTDGRVDVLGLVDHDDAQREAYYLATSCALWSGPRKSLSAWTNFVAAEVLAGFSTLDSIPKYLASFGDDHRCRTSGWDLKLIEAIEQMDGPGIAYGNDLLQGPNLPTGWVVSAEVVRAVGWMMLPTCAHLYVDAAVLALGRAADRITYRPDVVIEHLHPAAGKAPWDESYRDSNAPVRYEADRQAFEAWKRDGLEGDAAKVKALVREVAR